MINVTKEQWSGTRKELEDAVAAFKAEVEAHRTTVGVPAPFCENVLIENLANSNGYFTLESELKWVWKGVKVKAPVVYRRLDFNEVALPDETEVDYEPVGCILDEDGVSIRKETDSEILEKVKVIRQSYINGKREQDIASGVDFNGWSFDTDSRSVDNITAAVAFIKSAPDAGLTPPSTISWRDATNVDRDLTVVQLIGLGAAVFQKVQAAHFKARQLKDTIASCTTKEEVMAIDW
jgi:hypothetical protein